MQHKKVDFLTDFSLTTGEMQTEWDQPAKRFLSRCDVCNSILEGCVCVFVTSLSFTHEEVSNPDRDFREEEQ
jgi:hypothetical protein